MIVIGGGGIWRHYVFAEKLKFVFQEVLPFFHLRYPFIQIHLSWWSRWCWFYPSLLSLSLSPSSNSINQPVMNPKPEEESEPSNSKSKGKEIVLKGGGLLNTNRSASSATNTVLIWFARYFLYSFIYFVQNTGNGSTYGIIYVCHKSKWWTLS